MSFFLLAFMIHEKPDSVFSPVPLQVRCLFPPAFLKIFCLDFLQFNYNRSKCRFSGICLHDVLWASQIGGWMSVINSGKLFRHYYCKCFFFSSFFSFWFPSHMSYIFCKCPPVHRYSVLVFVIPFFLYFSFWEVSTDVSASSQTASLAQISLVISQKAFFISVLVCDC